MPVVILVLVLGAAYGRRLYTKSIVPRTVSLEVGEGFTYRQLQDSLFTGGKITDPGLFRVVATLRRLESPIKPGHYELRKGMTANEVVVMFRSGRQSPIDITFNNIRTMEQLAGRLGSQLDMDSALLVKYLKSDSVAAEYGFTPENFICMFVPNTYEVYKTISPSALMHRMGREYDRFWAGRDEKIERTGLKTREEVCTLASIVMEESSKEDEFRTIAGVYINRIKQGIQLQADPTIIFAVGDPDLRRVRQKHLEIDSPYNTYKNKGLPPGPIRMPSIAAIDAVLDYEEHGYIYFCAKPDFSGYHAFARTLAEHRKNARAYTNALNTAGIR